MEIEVRRNFDITCTVKAECDVNLLKETFGIQDLTESQKKRLEEAEGGVCQDAEATRRIRLRGRGFKRR